MEPGEIMVGPSRNDQVDIDLLPLPIRADLADFGIDDQRLITVLNAYLQWNGIIGFTESILSIIEAAVVPLSEIRK